MNMKEQTKSFSKRRHQQFKATVWAYYYEYQRSSLPWRQTTDPYRIVVSEFMLQQTQVARVIPKYKTFLRHFPTTKQLAKSSLVNVLSQWQGLGYNRRAKQLHECAKTVHSVHYGRWPRTAEALQRLPGIGPYTAGAVAAFAYKQPVICLETNIRTAVIFHYFPNELAVSDGAIQAILEETQDLNNPRDWYWALMDYGAYLKKIYGNFNQHARSYKKQMPFKGSDREIRGAVIRLLTQQQTVSIEQLLTYQFDENRVLEQCQALCREELIEAVDAATYRLRS